MNREEALAKATAIVEKLGNAEELNKRGYRIDGWKPPAFGERIEAIRVLADFLVTPVPVAKLAAPDVHLHRASCDDSGGNLVCGYPPGPTILDR